MANPLLATMLLSQLVSWTIEVRLMHHEGMAYHQLKPNVTMIPAAMAPS